MKLDVQVDAKEVTEALAGLEKQMTFVMATALNAVGNDAQKVIQGSLSQSFTLRRPDFIRRTIKRNRSDFATKSNLVAIVRIDPERDVLAKFTEDGEKVPTHGRQAIAIPTEAVRRTKSQVIAAKDRPRALLAKTNGDARGFRLGEAIYRVLGRGKQAVLQKVYTLKKRVGIRKRLNFTEGVEGVVYREWPKRAEEALSRALATLRV